MTTIPPIASGDPPIGGGSWSVITPNSNRDDSSAPYASSLSIHWMGDLEIDPFNRDVAMFTTGYGLYRTTNLTAATPTWSFFNDGFEQSAVLELSSPDTGDVHLMSAIGDRDGYRHDDFSQSPSLGRLGQNTGWPRAPTTTSTWPSMMPITKFASPASPRTCSTPTTTV